MTNYSCHFEATTSESSVVLGYDSCLALFFHGDDEVLLGHETVLSNVSCEPLTEVGLRLKHVVQRSVVVVGVGEDAVYSPGNGT